MTFALWAAIYIGIPQHIFIDQTSLLRKLFGTFALIGALKIQDAGRKAHFRVNITEQYYQPLSITFFKLIADYPGTDKHLSPALFLMMANNNSWPNHVIPLNPLFDEQWLLYTRSAIAQSTFTVEQDGMAANYAWKEKEGYMSKMYTDHTLRHGGSSPANVTYEHDEKVLPPVKTTSKPRWWIRWASSSRCMVSAEESCRRSWRDILTTSPVQLLSGEKLLSRPLSFIFSHLGIQLWFQLTITYSTYQHDSHAEP